ncbi:AbrB family transcriptional regulator [Sedimentitalea sp. JM2-8]|uniref:AbrB family transcriptional regulator n=1 Tax=Sedimentitalea xiamensis TaxID=3050037 RepID=A0ABT7FFJ7_9RHOB|nr:AbrB family transcriptional regulator [Sedimentitalea xiamensis]MDK3073901.1 AbrB family transcriptional regulator [Sedimentitalea xiamensis]
MSPKFLAATLFLLIIGSVVGWLAHLTPMPLPFMLGSLLVAGIIAIGMPNALPHGYGFPQPVRTAFIAIIGFAIGSDVTSELIGDLDEMVYSLIAVSFFVLLAHMINYQIFRRLGKMDRTTAIFAGAPGGLIESVTLGEGAGADTRHIVLQQFLRIIFVVALVPIAMSLWVGYPVGSAGGIAAVTSDEATASGMVFLLAATVGGILAARLLRLPAGELTGPLLVAATLNLVGVGAPATPSWLLNASQIVIGVSLGARFSGFSGQLLLQGIRLGAVSVICMLTIGTILALLILPLTNQPLSVLLITFSPGGVTEMGLIALSLHANPAFVTLHHIYRITLTILLLGFWAKRLPVTDAHPR